MEADNADANEAQAPDFVQAIIDYNGGEFIGASDDGERVGMYTDRVDGLHTDIALKNGYVVAEVSQSGGRSDYKLNVQFKRLA